MRDNCDLCGKVISTTADPNNVEGWFVSLEHAEQLESEIAQGLDYPRGWLKERCMQLIVCADCQVEKPKAAPHAVRLNVEGTPLCVIGPGADEAVQVMAARKAFVDQYAERRGWDMSAGPTMEQIAEIRQQPEWQQIGSTPMAQIDPNEQIDPAAGEQGAPSGIAQPGDEDY